MTAFDSLDDYVAGPRVGSVAASADGSRLFATISQLSPDGKRYASALWELDPAGDKPAVRLTRSAAGEAVLCPTPTGELLFVSKRPGAKPKDDDDAPALWSLPLAGEARKLVSRPGGISGVAVASGTGTVIVASPTLAASTDLDDEKTRRKARDEADVNAILHESSPIRYWDHDLGPDAPRLFVGIPSAASESETADAGIDLRDLTPSPARALDEQRFVVTPDGKTVITGWSVEAEPGYPRTTIVAIDVATGDQRTLAADDKFFFDGPEISPDGEWIVCTKSVEGEFDEVPDYTLWLLPIDGGEGRDLLPADELWPTSYKWSTDSKTIFFTADRDGRAPAFRLELDGTLTCLASDGHYSSLAVTTDAVFALRDQIESPPTPVRLDPKTADQTPTVIPCPGAIVPPGTVTEVETTVADGTRIRAWLALPEGASADAPVPLVLWIHGGPVSSWNGWSWRWNPWLLVAKGYAVLLPDPAFSTGYGRDMVRRGWGQWGGAPYDDLMAITDVAVERADIDETRTAAMGGSYGGYMANWVAGHTDRFRCIVTHASLWALDQFAGTTDMPAFWLHEFGDPVSRPERYTEYSPHRFLDKITTPMLVIHGDRDYRVPIGEGLRLWWDLQRTGVESKFLYFPDENHWVLKPGDAKVWYATVFAWLGKYVLDQPWEQPDLV